jgi:HK97 family phage major capsid protein
MEEEKELLEKIEKQTSEQIGAIKTEFKELVEKLLAGSITKEQLDEQLSAITEKTEKFEATVNEKLAEDLKKTVSDLTEKFELEINALKEQGINEKPTTFRDRLAKAFEESGYIKEKETPNGKTKVFTYFEGKEAKSSPVMTVKAAVDMTTANIYGSNVELGSPFYTSYELTPVQIPLNNDIRAMQVFPVSNITTKYMGIIVENNYVDGSATTAENTAAGKSSVLFETAEFKVFKINTYFHVPEENLDDVDFLLDELARLAPDKIMTKLDSKILSASGDNSTDIKGLFVSGNFTAFASATTYVDSQEGADIIDVVRKMKLQAKVAGYNVNIVGLNPADIDIVEGLKDLNENSKFNRIVKYDSMGNLVSIAGLRVMDNKQITANTCFVADVRYQKIGVRKDITMQIGLDSDDLTTGMRTIVFGMRAAYGGKDANSVIYCDDIQTAISDINKA